MIEIEPNLPLCLAFARSLWSIFECSLKQLGKYWDSIAGKENRRCSLHISSYFRSFIYVSCSSIHKCVLKLRNLPVTTAGVVIVGLLAFLVVLLVVILVPFLVVGLVVIVVIVVVVVAVVSTLVVSLVLVAVCGA